MKTKQKNRGVPTHHVTTLVTVALLVVLEIVILVSHVIWVSRALSIVNLALRLLSFIVMLHIVNGEENTAYKLAWCIPILLIPLVGGIAYLIAKSRTIHKKAIRHVLGVRQSVRQSMPGHTDVDPMIGSDKRIVYQYLKNKDFDCFPCKNTRYYKMADEMFYDLLIDLENAERFIFMEYFIIQEGRMWNSILEILKKKASLGVDVRIIYDGMGCIRTLPANYAKALMEYGIKAQVFMPFVPFITTLQNNRDHRKITVIDGKVCYTGGSNLADEYINEINRFGTWKDSAVRLEGGIVDSFTRFFLTQWHSISSKSCEDLSGFFSDALPVSCEDREAVIGYSVSPLDKDNCAKDVYLQIIHSTKRYLYIMTPYLIPGEEIINALKRSAKSGVDVRLITPAIPDNRWVHCVSRSQYDTLLQAGVKIYEYTPGFIHSKNIVCDDELTLCGTINFDYRSLYLHFECASVIFGNETAKKAKEDFMQTFSVSRQIQYGDQLHKGMLERLYPAVIRTFEPLL